MSKAKFDKTNSDFETFKLTFDNVYNSFIRLNGNDVFEGLTRSEFRTKSNKLPESQKLAKLRLLKSRPKQIETDNLNYLAPDPFELMKYDIKTPVQETMIKHSNWMKYYGNYAYCCACGAGKTLAGVYLIHKFQCKTLIISSRNAVNDQWLTLLKTLYPELIIETKNGWIRGGQKLNKREADELKAEGFEADIMIFSPQYLSKYVDNYNLTASLIIYDEVHSLLSTEFIKVLLLPLYKVIEGSISELPYMLALSATYPTEATQEGKESIKRLNKLFGSVFKLPSEVRRIPVLVWDYRDHFTREDRLGKILTGEDALGGFDSRYVPLSDCEAVDYFISKIHDEHHVAVCNEFKGIIMTHTIDSSAYAALKAHETFNCSVILVRSADEYCLYLPADEFLNFEYTDEITFKELVSRGIGHKVQNYVEVVDECAIIVGTDQRLKEGFSVQNIVWGICSKFVYSSIARVQILGRIRRNSKNDALNQHERIFYVCSGSIPTTIGIPNYRGKHKITYDIRGEAELFRMENYVRV